MKSAVRWHFALDRGSTIQPPDERERTAVELAESNRNRYGKDRPGEAQPELTVALESIEHHLDLLGRAKRDRPSVKVGSVTVPDVVPISTCARRTAATETMTFEFEREPRDSRPNPPNWRLLQDLIPELGTEAKAAGRQFRRGEALDLVAAKELRARTDGTRRYKIGVAETDYYRWAVTANSLDRDLSRHPELTEKLGATTLRQAWGHAPECLEDLADLPAPAYIGVCVVVIAESQIVVLERQRKHFVAGAEPSSTERDRQPRAVHFVGEGVEPKDHGKRKNPPHQAAHRGCKEELNVAATDIELTPTAVVLDTLRWQPVFCYVAELRLSVPDLELQMQHAKHNEETGGGRIAALVPWTVADPGTRSLLAGGDPEMRLASNHAQAALLYALVYADGMESVAKQLAREVA